MKPISRLGILLVVFVSFSIQSASAQVRVEGQDTLSAERYSRAMTDYYIGALDLNNRQQQKVYDMMLKEKNELNIELQKCKKHAASEMAWKRFYAKLDARFNVLCTTDQYSEYLHLNTIQIKTISIQ